MWWEEQEVEHTLEQYLLANDWAVKEKPRRVRVDLLVEKMFEDESHTLILEVKGDVRNPQYDPAAYRNKYMQIVVGQLVCRTGAYQCGYDNRTILGLRSRIPARMVGTIL